MWIVNNLTFATLLMWGFVMNHSFFSDEQKSGKPISVPKEIKELEDYTDEMCIKFSTNLDGMLTYAEMENLLNNTQYKKKWEFNNFTLISSAFLLPNLNPFFTFFV